MPPIVNSQPISNQTTALNHPRQPTTHSRDITTTSDYIALTTYIIMFAPARMSTILSPLFSAFARLLRRPNLAVPHATFQSFDELPEPLRADLSFPVAEAVVLDKDNCFALPGSTRIYPAYQEKFQKLRAQYPKSRLLIVSNGAGSALDHDERQARELEQNTGVKVLIHSEQQKPSCHTQIIEYFRAAPDFVLTSPAHIVVVGDRLLTDVMVANMMGSQSIWLRKGVQPDNSITTKMETSLSEILHARGINPPQPRDSF